MNGHLTEQQLIDYAFKLASDAAMAAARTHLERCDACGEKLEALKRKFAALDVLRDDVKASEALVATVVEHSVRPRRRSLIPLYQRPWLGATAATIIVGVALLWVSNLEPSRLPAPPAGPSVFAPASGPVAETETPLTRGPERFAAANKEGPAAAARPPKAQAGRRMVAASIPPAEAAEEKPPFAPASAIELVVLPRRENVQLTIYNAADLTLVRERRNLTLKKGWNWLQFMWANTLIDPTSLSLEPLEHGDQVEIQQLVFPPRLRELGRWLIRSEVSGRVPFELTYFTSGLSWRAFYLGTLSRDEKRMHLEGHVRVQNGSGEDYEEAQTRLIVGRVHLLDQIAELARRPYPYGSPVMIDEEADEMRGPVRDLRRLDTDMPGLVVTYEWNGAIDVLKPKEIRKEGLSEYFLYTIEGTETIPNAWGKRLRSFQADDIPVKDLYKYDEQRWGTQTIRFLSFANDEEHKLGETPLPDGMIRLYSRADAEGHLSYAGGTSVKYIPVGEEVELNLGPARLVQVQPTLMDFRTDNYVYDREDDIAGWDEIRTWKVEIANARTLPVEIELTRAFETAYWTLESGDRSVSYEKHDATRARFRLAVSPRTKQTFEYTVTTYHGVREATRAEIESRARDTN